MWRDDELYFADGAQEVSRSEAINLAEKLSKFSEHWSPLVVAEMNDYQFKVVKLVGEFVWHDHKDTDEVFLVLKGEMEIGFRDRSVTLKAGEMFVVPRGVEHMTRAALECHAMLIEPRGTLNTGEAGDRFGAAEKVARECARNSIEIARALSP